MAGNFQSFSQTGIQRQTQKQTQRMSQKQIQAVRFLSLQSRDLRDEIYKFAEENPALEIISDESFYNSPSYERTSSSRLSSSNGISADEFQSALENSADDRESLQAHLTEQINMMRVSEAKKNVCISLINSLDKNGCLPALINPESFLDRSDPHQNKSFLKDCIKTVQSLDPIGNCCKSLEDSLFVQAEILNPDDKLALFLLDGHLEFLNPPHPDRILTKILDFQKEWHSKAFAAPLPIDQLTLSENAIEKSLKFILTLNPHPAAEFSYDSSLARTTWADVALIIEKKDGYIQNDDFEKGLVKADDKAYFQIKYPSGTLPEIRIAPEFLEKSKNTEMQAYRQKYLQKAQDFIGNLAFRQSTMILQGCHIVKKQIDFFLNGPGNIHPYTRHELANEIHVHESTVSRVSSKNNGRFFQTDWGLFPVSYFFSSGVSAVGKTSGDKTFSAEQIKVIMQEILEKSDSSAGEKKLSDPKLTQILNERGIKISRRTVSKYRLSLNISSVYDR